MSKRVISLIITFVLLLSSCLVVFANNEDQAVDLNKLNLIAGDDNGYNLNGQLKRSEAATFIVKLLGKEKEVLANSIIYTNSNFPDLVATEWYAPFVGYCEREYIISGYPDGEFKANETLSEKAFLSMMLKAMGYTDVAWDDVNTKAYEIGLVRDSSYIGKTTDNTDFRRGDVVNIMHNSLKLMVNGTENTVVGRLVADGVVELSVVDTLGLLSEDDKLTEISSVNATADDTIVVKLNEEINDLDASQISVYEKDDSGNQLSISDYKLDGQTLTLTTAKQPKGEKYVVALTSVIDKENNFVASVLKNFETFEIKEITSDFFLISKVEGVSDERINVYFTHPIRSNAALPQYYDLYDAEGKLLVDGSFSNMKVKKLGGVDNAVGIYLTDKSMIQAEDYTLKVSSNVKSKYYVNLDDGSGDQYTFNNSDYTNQSFKVDNVSMVKNKVFRVTFSSDVDMSSALNKNNYYLRNKTEDMNMGKPIKVVSTGTPNKSTELRQVDLVFGGSITEEDTYELQIDNVKDLFEELVVDDEKYDVYAYWDDYNVTIDTVVALNDTHIRAYMSHNIDPSSVATSGILINSGANNVNAKASIISDNTIDVFLDSGDELTTGTYEFRITAGIKDVYGDDIGLEKKEFSGLDYDYLDNFSIDEAKFVGADVIKVTLDEALNTTVNNESNFKLKYKDNDGDTQTISVDEIHFLDAFTVIVEDEDLSDNKSFRLHIINTKDFSNQHTINEMERSVTY